MVQLSSPIPPDSDGRDARWWVLLAAVIALAVALRQVVVANTDVSWLLTVAEKVLGGQQLYRDVIETNPPMAMLAYLPGVVLGRLLHIRAETATDALVFIGVALSTLAAVRILTIVQLPDRIRRAPLLVFCVAVLTVMPMQAFGQREHLAFIALLPALAAMMVRAQGQRLPLWAILAAGLGAGLTLTFKPYFIVPVGAGIVTAAWLARSWRALFAAEYFIAAALVVAYGLATVAVFPDYFTVIYPLVRDVYIPMTAPLLPMLVSLGMAVWAAAFVLSLVVQRPVAPDAVITLLLAVSAGFAVAYLVQRKGWAYQSYPMIALALMAAGYALAGLHAETKRRARLGGLVALAALFLGGAQWMNDTSDARVLVAPVARLGDHPKILVLSGEASIGHPLTRIVGGEWVSRQQDLWVREFVTLLRRRQPIDPETNARFDTYMARERAMLIDDITRNPPDVLVIDNLLDNWGDWLRADPELSALLKPFRLTDTVQNIEILQRIK